MFVKQLLDLHHTKNVFFRFASEENGMKNVLTTVELRAFGAQRGSIIQPVKSFQESGDCAMKNVLNMVNSQRLNILI